MADLPQSWAAYARLQQELSLTFCVERAAALEAALNVIQEPDYSVQATTEVDFRRVAEAAARRERYRTFLRRQYQGDLPVGEMPVEGEHEDCRLHTGLGRSGQSLDDNVHARRELRRLSSQLAEADFLLLIGLATGMTYDELARQGDVSPGALRTRVTRLRRALIAHTETTKLGVRN